MAGPELVPGALHLNGHAVIDGLGHLAGQKPAPDELVQPILLAGQVLLQLLRGEVHIRGTDGLVGVLGRVLGLEAAGLFGIIVLAVPSLDEGLGGSQSLLRQAQRVGSHVGNQTHGALSGDVHALIQLLGHGHGAPRGHVQLSRGLLLQGGGDKGRGGVTLFVLALDCPHCEGVCLHSIHDLLHLLGIAQFHLLVPAVELRPERADVGGDAAQVGGDGPVLLGHEGANLLLPLHHQTGGHGLHTARRQATADLLPQQGGELIAHDAVQNTPGLLGVHQVLVDLPGGRDGLGDHLAGDLVEGHPAGLLLGYSKHRLQVPGDGLSLSVRVGGQIDTLAVLGGLSQLRNGLFLILNILIVRLEGGHVHAQLALGQVPHVAHGRLHLIVRSQIFSNGFCLSW